MNMQLLCVSAGPVIKFSYTNTHCHSTSESQAFIKYIDSAKSDVFMTECKFKIRMYVSLVLAKWLFLLFQMICHSYIGSILYRIILNRFYMFSLYLTCLGVVCII
jgi:hypothetical protein